MEVIENKANKALLALAIGTTVMGASVTVQAEDVSVPTVNQTEATPSETVTAETVATAKTSLDEVNQNVSNQTEVVTQAQTEVNAASETVTSAEEAVSEAQAIKDQATPEAIAEQETVVSEATQAVTDTETLIDSDKAAIESKEVEITNQEAVVAEAQSDVATKEDDLAVAKDAEQQAQAILDGTGAQELYEQQENLETKIEEDKQAVSNAEDNLEKAQAADQKLAQDTTAKTNQVADVTGTVSSNKSSLDQATQTLNSATANYDAAQDELAQAQADLDSVNTFVVSQEYVDTLKAFVDSEYGTQERSDLKAKLDQLSNALKAQNVFKSNPYDKQVIINDPNNLTKDQIEELSLFGADLQNQIRSYFGTVPVVVTPDSIDMADLVTDGYVADGWGWDSVITKGHDNEALDLAGNNSDIGPNLGIIENLNTLGEETGRTTMDYLKSLVHMAYTYFLYADSNAGYGHAEFITGLAETSGATKGYIGVDISSVAGATHVHVNTINNRYLEGNKSFDTTEIASPYDTETLKATLATKQRAYNNAETALNNAKTSVSNAQTAYNSSKTELDALVKELEVLKATPKQTPKAQETLANAKDTLAKDQASLKAINDSIATLEADITVKKANLDKAKAVVAEKEADLAEAKESLGTEEATLASLYSELTGLKAQLAEDEAMLAKAKAALAAEVEKLALLENADENLTKALANLEEAKSLLDVAKITLSTETETLEALKAQQAQAQKTYDTVLAAYQAQELAKLEAKRQAIIESGQTAIPVVDENGQIVDYVAEIPKSSIASNRQEPTTHIAKYVQSALNQMVTHEETLKVVASRQTQNTYEAPLPNTGDASTATFTLMGMSFLALGVVGIRKRRLD